MSRKRYEYRTVKAEEVNALAQKGWQVKFVSPTLRSGTGYVINEGGYLMERKRKRKRLANKTLKLV